MEIIIILALVLLNGIFAMSEMSLVSSRRFKLENAKKKGVAGAKTAMELSENPTKFLSTVQIGITLIGILLGVYSGENLTNDVGAILQEIEFLAPYSDTLSVAVIVILVTYVSIVLGELVPKRLGLTFPEPIAILLARPMKVLSVITSPFVWLLMFSNDAILKLLGIKKSMDSRVSEEEIKSIIKESATEGEIQDIEHDIMERVFELGDRRVNTLQTHRTDIVFFDATDTYEIICQKINQEKHSAYPVCKNQNIDDILGLVLLKDLFNSGNKDQFDITDYIKNPIYVNESTFAYKLLEMFKTQKIHYAIVVDEYGSTKGIVSMDDVLDALVGDVTEYNQDEYQITQRDERSWFVDGQYPTIEFLKYFDLEIPESDQNHYVTVAGLFINIFLSIPNEGDKITLKNIELEVIDKDGHRIDKLLVTKKPGLGIL